jgi:hypothetical protein
MYFQYEFDGATESYNPRLPSTSACPSLPGQTVNTMSIPEERRLRQRSASMNSLRQFNYRTTNPESKFTTPKPPTALQHFEIHHLPQAPRHGSAPGALQQPSATRPLSPAPVWRRIFARKASYNGRDSERSRLQGHEEATALSAEIVSHTVEVDDASRSRCLTPSEGLRSRSRTPSEGIRTRDISPESLRRFLSEDAPLRPESNMSERPALIIPEDIVEENEDDDNFATSAVSETHNYPTCLSPPPMHKKSISIESVQRSLSVSAVPTLSTVHQLSSALQRRPSEPVSLHTREPIAYTAPQFAVAYEEPASFFSGSTATSPASLQHPEDECNTFYDSCDDDDDDDALSVRDEDMSYAEISPGTACPPRFEGYSLPEVLSKSSASIVIPKLDVSVPFGTSGFLTAPIDSGLDEFVTEMGWLVESIGSKAN